MIRTFKTVIPIYQSKLFRQPLCRIRRQDCLRVIIALRLTQAEEHIAPHHRRKVVFFCNRGNFFDMADHKLILVRAPMKLFISSLSEAKGFIQSDMDAMARKAHSAGTDHLLDKIICLRFIYQQNTLCIAYFIGIWPSKRCLQMPECLNARDAFNTELLTMRIDCPQFILRIGTSHISKPRILLDLVCILSIEHQHIESH